MCGVFYKPSFLHFRVFQYFFEFFASSGIEHKNDIYSCAQLEANNNNNNNQKLITSAPIVPEVKHEPVVNETVVQIVPSTPSPSEHKPKEDQIITNIVQDKCIKPTNTSSVLTPKEHRPRSVTASVFAPVTADITPQLVALQLQSQRPATTAGTISPCVQLNQKTNNSTQILQAGSGAQHPVSYQPTKDQRTQIGSRGGAAMNKSFMMFLDEGNDSK